MIDTTPRYWHSSGSLKNIAGVGAGISGLAAASRLSRRHRVHLFGQEGRLGGHTTTVLVDGPNGTIAFDTGFPVHNDRTYPDLAQRRNLVERQSPTRTDLVGAA
jgi:predicted NAD/FAD-binding protein